MNDLFFATLICWTTRNIFRSQKTKQECKNFGLQKITNNMYLGNLKVKERAEIAKRLKDILIKKTDQIVFINLCQSCLKDAGIDNVLKKKIIYPNFEIIGF